jgi:N utilization substance protein B
MSNRRQARKQVMKALYARELAGGQPEHFIHTLIEPDLEGDASNLDFATKLFRRTVDRQAEIDRIVSAHAENWDLDRIAAVDRSLLRMATCELLTFEEVPPKVSIDEAIEIAKQYSTEKSSNFINGILDSILMKLQREGRLQKKGRGLIGMESIRERANSASSQ